MARDLMMHLDETIASINFLLRDRDTKVTAAFDALFTATDIRMLRRPIRAPSPNAIMEGWIGDCRRELLDQTQIWNQRRPFTIVRAYETHHNEYRPHRSLDQAAPLTPLLAALINLDSFRLQRRSRVSGFINEYTIAA